MKPDCQLDKHVHFIGIGGVGMSGLASILLSRGVRVTGSDPHTNAATDRLAAAGATVYGSQTGVNLNELPELIVVTAAVHEDNPEYIAAMASGVPVVSRAEMLGRMMAQHAGPRIAIAGTHGKTTTTAMTAAILIEAGLDPTVLVGGEFGAIGGNVRVGREVFLTEACEAYGSFHALAPDIAVITNLEADHLDYYGTEERVFQSFETFLSRVPSGGLVVWCGDDPGVSRLSERMRSAGLRILAYGLGVGPGERLYAQNVETSGMEQRYALRQSGVEGDVELGEIELAVPGVHNVLNSLAAAAAAMDAGAAIQAVQRGLAQFAGTGRRFELVGEGNGILVLDDYAHHPTEIRAALAAARAAYPERRIVVVFQPHLYSRTRDFLGEFALELSAADLIVIAGIYAAREEPIPGVHGSQIVREIARLAPEKTAIYEDELAGALRAVRWIVRPGDLLLTMGAGDIREVADRFTACAEAVTV